MKPPRRHVGFRPQQPWHPTPRSASHSRSSCCVLAPVDYGCHTKSEHVSLSDSEARRLHVAGESWNSCWWCECISTEVPEMLTPGLLSASEGYFVISCPTQKPAVGISHKPSRIFHTFPLKAPPLCCLSRSLLLKKAAKQMIIGLEGANTI